MLSIAAAPQRSHGCRPRHQLGCGIACGMQCWHNAGSPGGRRAAPRRQRTRCVAAAAGQKDRPPCPASCRPHRDGSTRTARGYMSRNGRQQAGGTPLAARRRQASVGRTAPRAIQGAPRPATHRGGRMGCCPARMRPLSLLLAAHTGAAARRAARATGAARRAVLEAGAAHALPPRAATGAAAHASAAMGFAVLQGCWGRCRACSEVTRLVTDAMRCRWAARGPRPS